VMNTDNMTISGETIDYGPCAFMDAFDPATVFSSIDADGRYAYGNQPVIARWNLARLAETLLPLIDPDVDAAIAAATVVIDEFPGRYEAHRQQVMRAKLGLSRAGADDAALIDELLGLMHAQRVDFTSAFRRLADTLDAASGGPDWWALWRETEPVRAWHARWQARLAGEGARSAQDTARAMRAVNPIHIPRNHRVEEALEAAVAHGDLAPFERLLAVLKRPFEATPEGAYCADPAPPALTAGYKTYCGT